MSYLKFKYVFKYIIIGDPSVGKSCLLNQFINNKFSDEYQITVGVEFGAKILKLPKGNIKLQIWDTAGQESFKSITRGYYRSACVAIIVYDITDLDSFKHIENWLEECRTNGNKEMTLVLIGNKCDLEKQRKISTEEGRAFAERNKLIFFETSAKLGKGVKKIFEESARDVFGKIDRGKIDPENESYGVRLGAHYNFLMKPKEVEKKKCC